MVRFSIPSLIGLFRKNTIRCCPRLTRVFGWWTIDGSKSKPRILGCIVKWSSVIGASPSKMVVSDPSSVTTYRHVVSSFFHHAFLHSRGRLLLSKGGVSCDGD